MRHFTPPPIDLSSTNFDSPDLIHSLRITQETAFFPERENLSFHAVTVRKIGVRDSNLLGKTGLKNLALEIQAFQTENTWHDSAMGNAVAGSDHAYLVGIPKR